jgi:hypothetical protein
MTITIQVAILSLRCVRTAHTSAERDALLISTANG